MRIALASVFVEDQERALHFYTEVLGFEPHQDMPVGEFRWLTVRAPGRTDIELCLEPAAHPAAATFQAAIRSDGIPATSLAATDVRAEHARLAALGVEFTMEPISNEMGTFAIFDDGCGNLIQLHQES